MGWEEMRTTEFERQKLPQPRYSISHARGKEAKRFLDLPKVTRIPVRALPCFPLGF